MSCPTETTSFVYPLLADIFYPIVDQGGYGNLKKQWVLDRIIACGLEPAGRKFKQDVQPDVNVQIDNSLVGRTRHDITESSNDLYSVTNIIITNIRDSGGNIIYNESSGKRKGKATIFEVASINPIIGAFGSTEYYKLVIRRSENQGADV
jgi:hypothetical protein